MKTLANICKFKLASVMREISYKNRISSDSGIKDTSLQGPIQAGITITIRGTAVQRSCCLSVSWEAQSRAP